MRWFVVAFVAGCWALQQQATLPSQFALLVAALALALLAIGMATRARRLHVALRGLAFGAAFCWAAWRAELRMRDWLPAALESRDLDVRGVVSGLPANTAGGTRFAFTVEQAEADVQLPDRVILNWRGAPPDLRPGQRLTLTVRLRRPRGLANPFGFDYAYWLLAQGYGATGYVRRANGPPQDASGERLAWRIEAQRAAVREHLRAALPPEARFGAVVIALVIGDQRGIVADDWQLFRRTGISHLVAISGLHITMIAGMVASAAALLWRRSFGLGRWLRRPLPLWLPARQAALVAAVAGALTYGLLAGMQIPALRTVAMLCVAAVAGWGARAPPASVVLAWAALVALLLDPWAVMSPGFWLSFGAVAVIFFAARPGARCRAGRTLATLAGNAGRSGAHPMGGDHRAGAVDAAAVPAGVGGIAVRQCGGDPGREPAGDATVPAGRGLADSAGRARAGGRAPGDGVAGRGAGVAIRAAVGDVGGGRRRTGAAAAGGNRGGIAGCASRHGSVAPARRSADVADGAGTRPAAAAWRVSGGNAGRGAGHRGAGADALACAAVRRRTRLCIGIECRGAGGGAAVARRVSGGSIT